MRVRTLTSVFAVGVTLAGFVPRADADQCTPARLMLVLDKSSSMESGTIGGVSKWQIAVDALDQVVSSFEDSIELGINVFPNPNQCSPGTTLVTPGLGNAGAIMSALGDAPPEFGNWTPMAQSLAAVATEPSLTAPGAPRYALLITDGWQWCDPYDPATRFDPVDAVTTLSAAGITTYVVGFGAAVDALVLNTMAVEAGTARPGCDPSGDVPGLPGACYYAAGDPTELVAALQDIAVTVSGEICDGLDNDCDGQVDEGLVQACASACGTGSETCVDGTWEGCDAPAVEADVCDGADNDCDGVADPGCDCAAGETRACGGTETAGECSPGVQTCGSDGTWGLCEGATDPANETCDGLDNDCDGETDEMGDDVGTLCAPGFECRDGNCDPMDPVIPPGDDTPAADDGDPSGGCGCTAGASSSEGFAGSLLVILGCAMLLGARRRRRG